ncbi:MAG: N-formylglutamate amidohydrolase [Flavobacteriales bacterium]|jgi:N-formylglutamate amidohydrolase
MTMTDIHSNYNEQLAEEIQKVPSEYLPALLTIVHSFRASVSLPTATESFEQGWKEVMAGDTHPIDSLWDDIES